MTKLRIFCGTWNVNAKSPPQPQELSNWLCKGSKTPDIVAISCQEIVQLSDVTQYFQSKKGEDVSELWSTRIKECLENYNPYEGAKYTIVGMSHLIGIMTCVLVRSEYVAKVSKVMIGYFAVGRFGVLGNKGAVGIRFRLRTGSHRFKTFCFVGAHLTPHRGEVSKRNADFFSIWSGMTFHPVDSGLSGPFLSRATIPLEQIVGTGSASDVLSTTLMAKEEDDHEENATDFAHEAELVAASYGKGLPYLRIESHDLVFWFGDLNYRVDTFSSQDAVQAIKRKNISQLLLHDQLITERKAKRVFNGFEEGVINFDPTYKFIPGTSRYDTADGNESSKKKSRVPAWCDRVLWKCDLKRPRNQAQQCSYFSVPELDSSDHKPVGSEFLLPFVEINASKKKSFKSSKSRSANVFESASRGSLPRKNTASGFGWSAKTSSGTKQFRGSSFSEMPTTFPLPPPPPQTPQSQGVQEDLVDEDGFMENAMDDIDASDEAIVSGALSQLPFLRSRLSQRKTVSTTRASCPSQTDDDETWATASYCSDGSDCDTELSEAYEVLQSVCSLVNYESQSPDELTLHVGDLLELLPEEKLLVDDGWVLGRQVHDGKTGYFKADAVTPLGAVKTKLNSMEGNDAARKATALRYHRKIEERAAEKQAQEGPSSKRLSGNLGGFPFVSGIVMKKMQQLISRQSLGLTPRRTWSMEFFSRPKNTVMVAKEDYEGRFGDEVSVERGQVVQVLSSCPQSDEATGWYMVELSDGQHGLVPRRVFEPVSGKN